jgi:hypothetical protein
MNRGLIAATQPDFHEGEGFLRRAEYSPPRSSAPRAGPRRR